MGMFGRRSRTEIVKEVPRPLPPVSDCPTCLRGLSADQALEWSAQVGDDGKLVVDGNGQEVLDYRRAGDPTKAQVEHFVAHYESSSAAAAAMQKIRRPLRCPNTAGFGGVTIKTHFLPDKFFERANLIVGFVGPSGSTKSTLMALTCQQLLRTFPAAFRTSGYSFALNNSRKDFDKRYADFLDQHKPLDATPIGEPEPWVSLTASGPYRDYNIVFCDSAGENFQGRRELDDEREGADAEQAAAIDDMPFLYSANVFVVCVPPEAVPRKTMNATDMQTAQKNADHLIQGIQFLIESRESMGPAIPLHGLPSVLVVFTKSDVYVQDDRSDTAPVGSGRYKADATNGIGIVEYDQLLIEVARCHDESIAARSWLQKSGLHLFAELERYCQYVPGEPAEGRYQHKKPLFANISYHFVSAMGKGISDNKVYVPPFTHNRLLDPMVMALSRLDAQSEAANGGNA